MRAPGLEPLPEHLRERVVCCLGRGLRRKRRVLREHAVRRELPERSERRRGLRAKRLGLLLLPADGLQAALRCLQPLALAQKQARTLAEHAPVVRRIRLAELGERLFLPAHLLEREARLLDIRERLRERAQLLIRQRRQRRVEDLIDHRRLEIARELRTAQLDEEAHELLILAELAEPVHARVHERHILAVRGHHLPVRADRVHELAPRQRDLHRLPRLRVMAEMIEGEILPHPAAVLEHEPPEIHASRAALRVQADARRHILLRRLALVLEKEIPHALVHLGNLPLPEQIVLDAPRLRAKAVEPPRLRHAIEEHRHETLHRDRLARAVAPAQHEAPARE